MFGFGYGEVLLLVLLIGIPAAIWVAARLADKYPPDEGGGIGGGLVILAIGVSITPFVLGWEVWQALLENYWSGVAPAQIGVGGAMIGILGAILVGWSIYNVVLFFRRRRIFPWSWICLNGVLIIFAIIGVVYDPTEAAFLGRVVFWTVVWAIYLLCSERAKATFVQ